MKRITLVLAFIGMITLNSCTVNEDNGNNIDNDTISEVFELRNINFSFDGGNSYSIYRTLNPQIYPSDNILNISKNDNILINNIAIYNVLGQLVISIPNAESVQNIDVSKLTEGQYFIVIKTEKGISNTKFIKK